MRLLLDYFSRFVKNFVCYVFQKKASKDHLTQGNLVWKCMEMSLYTPNIFQLGQEIMFINILLLFKTNKKIFYLLKSKKLNIK